MIVNVNLKRKVMEGSSLILLGISSMLLVAVSSCEKDEKKDNDAYSRIQPRLAKPSWGPTLTPQMQAVIETFDTIAPVPIFNLTPQQARLQPSAADAAARVMRNFNIPVPARNVDTMGRDIPVAGGSIHLRIYTPKTGKASYPVIVYYPGGGWVIATIDTYDASAQALAEKTDAVLISVAYRKGPEFKFPTAHKDAFAAYRWALRNASTIKGDSTKIAVAGESAGGNLAVAVSMMARDSSVRRPVHQLAVYPVANKDLNTASKNQYAGAKPLATPALPWFLMHYLNSTAEAANPLISLVDANLSGLPKTTIIAAEIDPLQTEGRQLADKLVAANIAVTYKLYVGVTHEFFGMAAVIPEARDAQDLAAAELKKSF
ncbi:MAG: alpha/beta hydrolase [Chitinophagaceae bacterium]